MTRWKYDSKDRLTGDALTGGAAYSLTNAYDSAGNPTTYRNVASQTFNADNQKTASGTFVYDGNGNPTTYAGGTLTFDPMDKMVSIASSGTGSYRYRADGLRAWKGWNVTIPTTSGIPVTGATYFLYDGGNPVVEMDSNGSVTAINVFAHDGLVARVEGSTAKYYQFDAQGSVAHRTNSSGSVTSSSKYEAYGKHVNIPGSTVDVYGWNARWGYYYDSETGLYLCQQRYYDSNQGRWLNRDPIRYRGGLNLYGYCGGSPVGGIDVTGTNFQFMILVAEDQDVAPPIAPPRFNIEENLCTVMKEAFLIYSTDDLGVVKFEKAMKWFKEQVKSGGVWDYKHGGHKEYENLGNWNYGATGSYLGLSDDTLLRGAGLYQKIYGTSTDAWGGPLGGPPYGDDPNDQYWIRKGIKFIQERGR